MDKKTWVKLYYEILDDPKIGTLSDKQWREYVTGLFDNPDNVHNDIHPIRLEYLLCRNKLKKALFARDVNECRYCGSIKKLEVDHIKPIAKGGANTLSNLQILCKKCNRAKGASYVTN